jgi:type IV secretion system protein VirD4
MGTVTNIWLLQLGAVLIIALVRSDWLDVAARLRAAILRPLVGSLTLGCFAFLYAAVKAGQAYDPSGAFLAMFSFALEALVLLGIIIAALFRRGGMDFIFGSARFATLVHAGERGLLGATGIRLGYFRAPEGAQPPERKPLHYTGERHLLTVAPTRAGKGVSTIIPNLLSYGGSCLVIDPKGENARATYDQRARLGQAFALDPWSISGKPTARLNPLALLRPDSLTLVEDATLLAEALVVTETGGNARHFSEQAADLIKGFLIHLATDPSETKTLGRLRTILTLPPSELAKVGIAMSRAEHPLVRAAAAQFITKSENERLGVLSTAQRNTHFLDSPALQASLAASDFSFADLKGSQPVSVYLILPVDRLTSHSRWLRLLIAQAIAELARTPARPPRPVLFLLDEFAQLGRLPIVEDAFGLMAGMGLQMHAIVQDLSQLQRLYGEGWQTFAANAGVMQFFNTRDLFTAQYVSNLIGMTTRTVRSTSTSSGSTSGVQGGGSNSGSSVSFAPTQRPLLYPDELMRMDRSAQVLFVENADPILADKIVWYEDPAYKALSAASVPEISFSSIDFSGLMPSMGSSAAAPLARV